MKFSDASDAQDRLISSEYRKSGALAMQMYTEIGEWVQSEFSLDADRPWSLDAFIIIMVALARLSAFYIAQMNVASPARGKNGDLALGWKVLGQMADLVKRLVPQQEQVIRAYHGTKPRV